MSTKQLIEIFEIAATRIAERWCVGCCAALGSATLEVVGSKDPVPEDFYEAIDIFSFFFGPKRKPGEYWWPDRPFGAHKVVEPRILALLMAAEMVKSGARP